MITTLKSITSRRLARTGVLLLLAGVFGLVAMSCSSSDSESSTEATTTLAAQTDAEPSGVVDEDDSGSGSDNGAATAEQMDDSDSADSSEDTADEGSEPADDSSATQDVVEAQEDAQAEDVEAEQDASTAESEDTEAAATQDSEPAGPQRIVSLSPTATEMLFAIGAGDQVVAVDQYSYYPPEAPVTDLDGWNPNVEAIASYDPDLVVMQGSSEVAENVEALGITVWSHDAPIVFADVYDQISSLGEITDRSVEAAELVEWMTTAIETLVKTAPDASGLTFYHELDNTLYTVTSNTFIGNVYGSFMMENVADPADADGSAWGYPQLSDEYLIDADPDLIFLADTLCCGQTAETVSARPGWEQLTAVQNGHIFELNDDVASRWGPRLVEFIEVISNAVTELFASTQAQDS